jgi:hypothetical protein
MQPKHYRTQVRPLDCAVGDEGVFGKTRLSLRNGDDTDTDTDTFCVNGQLNRTEPVEKGDGSIE